MELLFTFVPSLVIGWQFISIRHEYIGRRDAWRAGYDYGRYAAAKTMRTICDILDDE